MTEDVIYVRNLVLSLVQCGCLINIVISISARGVWSSAMLLRRFGLSTSYQENKIKDVQLDINFR